MPNLFAVNANDIHAAVCTHPSLPDMKLDAIFSLAQAAACAKKARVPLFLGGDIFDTDRPTPLIVRSVLNFLVDVKVLFIQGQHDFDPELPWLALRQEHIHLHKTSYAPDIVVSGLDYTQGSDLPAALAALSKLTTILLCHQPWKELMEHGGYPSVWQATACLPNLRLILSGDYHAYRVLEDPAHQVKLVSTGPSFLRSVRDRGPYGYVLVYDDYSTQFVPYVTRFVFASVIASSLDFDNEIARFRQEIERKYERIQALPKDLQKPLWIIACPEGSGVPEHVREHLVPPDGCHLLFQRIPERGEMPDAPTATMAYGSWTDVLASPEAREYLPTPAAFDLAVRLLREPNIVDTIDEAVRAAEGGTP
jgi:hypothetical protein